MSEHRGGAEGAESLRRIDHETVRLSEGPISLYLADHELRIVDPARDMDAPSIRGFARRINSRTDCLVIDPADYDVDTQIGYKGIGDGERITLGRRHDMGRFNFHTHVSARHVRLFRSGDTLEITDLGSTNGTYLRNGAPEPAGRVTLAEAETPTLPLEDDGPGASSGVYTVAGRTAGNLLGRKGNQDRFFMDAISHSLGVFDGMGNPKHAGSEDAAATAADSVERSLKVLPTAMTRAMAEIALREALETAHQDIARLKRPEIGTTAVAAKAFETMSGIPYVMTAGAGDSRAYLIRDGRIAAVTLDHIFPTGTEEGNRRMQEVLSQVTDLSLLSPKEYQHFKKRHLITSCLGQGPNPAISLTYFGLEPGDRVILTSDGVTDNLTDREIEDIVGTGRAAQGVVDDLIHTAQERSMDLDHSRSKRDDMTVAVLAYDAPLAA